MAAIAKELIWNEHAAITDVAALEDAKKSLSRMLEARHVACCGSILCLCVYGQSGGI